MRETGAPAYYPDFCNDYEISFAQLLHGATDVRYMGAIGHSFLVPMDTVLAKCIMRGVTLGISVN